jgi:hypothetical protein
MLSVSKRIELKLFSEMLKYGQRFGGLALSNFLNQIYTLC